MNEKCENKKYRFKCCFKDSLMVVSGAYCPEVMSAKEVPQDYYSYAVNRPPYGKGPIIITMNPGDGYIGHIVVDTPLLPENSTTAFLECVLWHIYDEQRPIETQEKEFETALVQLGLIQVQDNNPYSGFAPTYYDPSGGGKFRNGFQKCTTQGSMFGGHCPGSLSWNPIQQTIQSHWWNNLQEDRLVITIDTFPILKEMETKFQHHDQINGMALGEIRQLIEAHNITLNQMFSVRNRCDNMQEYQTGLQARTLASCHFFSKLFFQKIYPAQQTGEFSTLNLFYMWLVLYLQEIGDIEADFLNYSASDEDYYRFTKHTCRINDVLTFLTTHAGITKQMLMVLDKEV